MQVRDVTKNIIWKVQDDQGQAISTPNEVDRVFANYFINLFTTSSPTWEDIVKGTRSLQHKITDNMNFQLQKQFTTEEVLVAVKQITPLKLPGPDGFYADFYLTYWETIRGRYVAQSWVS